MEINELRQQINQIDHAMVALFMERMNLAAQVAAYKKQNQIPVYDPVREQEILQAITEQAGPELEQYITELYDTLFRLSRSYQSKLI